MPILRRHRFPRPYPPWRSVRARASWPVADEVGELVQDEPRIRDRPRVPGMTRKRKPIRGLQPQASPKRTMEDADVRDGQLNGRPLLDGLHAKKAGQRAVMRRGPEDKVRPATRISQRPGRREGGQARDVLDVDPVAPREAAVAVVSALSFTHSFLVVASLYWRP